MSYMLHDNEKVAHRNWNTEKVDTKQAGVDCPNPSPGF